MNNFQVDFNYWWLVAIRQEAITSANVDLDLCQYLESQVNSLVPGGVEENLKE